MIEIWKDIVGYEGNYQVSNYGNVKSLRRNEIYKKNGTNNTKRIRKEKILKNRLDKDGYCSVSLCKNGTIKHCRVHRLVLFTFDPNPKISLNHLDGNKQNNKLENLEWCSVLENNLHSIKMGFTKIGEKHYKAKLTNENVSEIKRLYQQNITITKIAKQFNVNFSTILDIIKKRSWKQHVLV